MRNPHHFHRRLWDEVEKIEQVVEHDGDKNAPTSHTPTHSSFTHMNELVNGKVFSIVFGLRMNSMHDILREMELRGIV